MKASAKRPLVIILIVCAAILLGFVTDAIWSLIDRSQHPTDYEEIISRYSEEYNIPKDVIYAVIKVESDFDPEAESSAGAMGLMQMIPSTFEWLTGEEHLNERLPVQRLFEPEVSIRYGTYYLAYLYRSFDYDWHIVFAAYNGGEGNVRKWLKDPECSDADGNLTHIPFKETRSYVSKVEDARAMYQELYPET